MPGYLPSNPSVERLKKEAKELLMLCKAGNTPAIQRIRRTLALFRFSLDAAISASVKLHHAQDAIARECGLANWSAVVSSIALLHSSCEGLSEPVPPGRICDKAFRRDLAYKKGLPTIGTSLISEHGVRYDVTDYSLAHTPQCGQRIRNNQEPNCVGDLMPAISFPDMSDRLHELYIETDCVTSRMLVFIDTMPDSDLRIGAPGFHTVTTPLPGDQYRFLLDASRIHETILAHEIGHVWVAKVDQIEDYRHLRDQTNLPRDTQFNHVQAFVMDLRVNDMLERRGFDMSVIAAYQIEMVQNLAASCVRGERPKNKRILAAIIASLANALLEMERFPARLGESVKSSIELIQTLLPDALEPAKEFVRSVLRHGYNSREAIRRVVNECATISFWATGESFDPNTDLIEVPHDEPAYDKHPEFLPGIPLETKLEVFRKTASLGITGSATYNLVMTGRERASVTLAAQGLAEPVQFSFQVDLPPQLSERCGVRPQQVPAASPHSRLPGPTHQQPPAFSGAAVSGSYRHLPDSVRQVLVPTEMGPRQFPKQSHPPTLWPQPHMSQASHAPGVPYPLGAAHPGVLPGQGGAVVHNAMVGPNGWDDSSFPQVPTQTDPFAEQRERVRKQSEEQHRLWQEQQNRRLVDQAVMTERICFSANGADLRPELFDDRDEYARLHPRKAIGGGGNTRNYMAGVGLFLSRVGFEQQADGEHPYGYANNNPVTYTDPSGLQPGSGRGERVPCPQGVAIARQRLCAEVDRIYAMFINNGWSNVPKCCTGPRQYGCL